MPEQQAPFFRIVTGDPPRGASKGRRNAGSCFARFTSPNIVVASAKAVSRCDALASVARRANLAMRNLRRWYTHSSAVAATTSAMTIASINAIPPAPLTVAPLLCSAVRGEREVRIFRASGKAQSCSHRPESVTFARVTSRVIVAPLRTAKGCLTPRQEIAALAGCS
jgi:hypothetical protein